MEEFFDNTTGINILIHIFERHSSSSHFSEFKSQVEDKLTHIMITSDLNRLFLYVVREEVYPDFVEMLTSDCSVEANEILSNCLVSTAGFESIKEIVSVQGIDIISKKLENLILYSSKLIGKKRAMIVSNISSLKNNVTDSCSDSLEDIKM